MDWAFGLTACHPTMQGGKPQAVLLWLAEERIWNPVGSESNSGEV